MNTKNIALSVIILFVLVLSAALGTTATATAGDEAENLNLTTQQELADAEGLEGDAWDDWLLWVLQMFWDAICNLQDEVEKIWTAIAPEQLLSKIKQVDGSGSDLDADTLDGKHASELETAVLSQCKICIQRSYGGGDSGQGALPEFPSALAPSGMECYSIDEWSDWIVDDTDGRAGGMATKIKIDCTPPYGD